MRNLEEDMQKLELTIIKSALDTETEKIIEESKSARVLIKDTSITLEGEIVSHMLKQNTTEKGIISWLKPGVSRKLCPEPIHLKAALKFIMCNDEFESTGYHICDLYTKDIDEQYDKINEIIKMPSNRRKQLPFVVKQFSLESYERLKALYIGDNNFAAIDYSKLLNAAKDINKTAGAVIHDVFDQKLKVHNTTGKSVVYLFNLTIQFITKLFIIVVYCL